MNRVKMAAEDNEKKYRYFDDETDDESPGAPQYMLLYASVMILLLAFFVVMQAFADEPRGGLFHAGRGSFVRALETMGLGRFMDGAKRMPDDGDGAFYYRPPDGLEDDMRSIDPEEEEAAYARMLLGAEFGFEEPLESGWNTVLAKRFSLFEAGDSPLDASETNLISQVVRRIAPMMAENNLIMGVGISFSVDPTREIEAAGRAAELGENLVVHLLGGVEAGLRDDLRHRMYSYCMKDESGGNGMDAHLRLEILVARPERTIMETR